MDPIDPITCFHSEDHVAALNVLRHAKNAFFWLAVVAVLLHAGSWAAVRYTALLDPLQPVVAEDAATYAGGKPAIPSEAERTAAARWKLAFESALALGGFVGRASVVVVAGLVVVALLVCLSGRTGEAAGLARSCVWSLAALAMLVPWLQAPEEVATATSAFYAARGPDRWAFELGNEALLVVRYLVCPVIVLVFLVVAQLRFRSACGRIIAGEATGLPIDEV